MTMIKTIHNDPKQKYKKQKLKTKRRSTLHSNK